MNIVNAAWRKCILSPIDLKLDIIGYSKTATTCERIVEYTLTYSYIAAPEKAPVSTQDSEQSARGSP